MKKRILLIALSGILIYSCQKPSENTENSSDVAQVESPAGFFGEKISEEGITSLQELVTALETQEEFTGKVMGEIKEVCTHKGCWMKIDLPNGESMRVTFKDYGFFVPKNSQGYPVVIEGVASKKVTDVASLKHYAEDAGKSKEEIEAITEPKVEYAFEAIGVIIKENA